MTSTGFVSQPVPVADATVDRTGKAGVKTDEDVFSGLLSRIAAGNQDDRRPGGEQTPPEGDQRRVMVWLGSNSGVLDDGNATNGDKPLESTVSVDPNATVQGALRAAVLMAAPPPIAGPNATAAVTSGAPPLPGTSPPPLPGSIGFQSFSAGRGHVIAQSTEPAWQATVNVAVPPASVVVKPLTGLTAIPGASLSVLFRDTSLALRPL